MYLPLQLALCVCFILADKKKSYNGAQVLKIHNVTKNQINQLKKLEKQRVLEIVNRNSNNMDVLVRKDKLKKVKVKLKKANIQFIVVMKNIQKLINIENPPLSVMTLSKLKGLGHNMTFEHFHRTEDIHGYLNYLEKTYPQFVEVEDIGESVEGHPLKLIKISSGVKNSESFWIDGGIHGREWISVAAVTYIISELVENRDAHADFTRGIDYYILPVFNPDGYDYSHLVDRMWRKNRHIVGQNKYCEGTDLNRNWDSNWGAFESNPDPCINTYPGEFYFSEPETEAVSRFILAHANNMKVFVQFHSYGQFILYPWAYTEKMSSDSRVLDSVGRRAAEAMEAVEGTIYTVGPSATALYTTSGVANDWAKQKAKIKYSYAIELRDKGNYGFMLPAKDIIPTAKEALAAIKAISLEVKRSK